MYNKNMEDKTILELAEELGIEKKTVENKLYALRKSGTSLGTLKGNTRYFSVSEQEQIKSLFTKNKSSNKGSKQVGLDSENRYLKERIATLERLLEQEQILRKTELEENKQLRIDYIAAKDELDEENHKSFWKKLFG